MQSFNPYMPYGGPCGAESPPPEDPERVRQREIYNLARELLVTSSRGSRPLEAAQAILKSDEFLVAMKSRFDAEAAAVLDPAEDEE